MLRINPHSDDDRFHRFGLIEWWDQHRLSAARVVVIGAGALGNEIVKNLALLGIGHVLICDKDHIENSNLSRSVLFRESDNGRPKATVAADAARAIYPGIRARPFVGDVVNGLGAGVFKWADVVLGGLDNREARLFINRQCFRLGRPWIDGAMEQINGVARVFVPEGHPACPTDEPPPCYECTMSQRDWQLLQHRRSCNGLTRDEMAGGRTPTTPTIGSIIAGLQCQELLKLLHNLPTIAGGGMSVVGLSTDVFPTRYPRKPDCTAHDQPDEILDLDAGAASITLLELLNIARDKLAAEPTLDLGRDLIDHLVCPTCSRTEPVHNSLSSISESQLPCPHCPGTRRQVVTFSSLTATSPLLERTPAQIGIPEFDILTARAGERSIALCLNADAPAVLGELFDAEIEL